MGTIGQSAIAGNGAVLNLPPDQVQVCDFAAVSTSDKSRLGPLAAANEAFAMSVTLLLTRQLGVACEVTCRSLDPSDGSACLANPEQSYFCSLTLMPSQQTALLQVDSLLVIPMVDALLGGSGRAPEAPREITEIEETIFDGVVQSLCQEFQSAWRPFGITAQAGKRQAAEQLRQAATPSSKVLISGFSVNLPEAMGRFQLALPASSLSAFTPGSMEARPATAAARKGSLSAALAEKLTTLAFGVDLKLPGARVRASDLIGLAPGKVLDLRVPVRNLTVLEIGGKASFEAVPVRSGANRAAQLVERIETSSEGSGNP